MAGYDALILRVLFSLALYTFYIAAHVRGVFAMPLSILCYDKMRVVPVSFLC
jgi:hypothetical protein